MVNRKAKVSKKSGERKVSGTSPKFPYTNKPGSLRRFLKDVPNKPKPIKFDQTLMRSWGFKDTNDMTMLRVLKSVDLLNDKNEPTDKYSQFMRLDVGAKILGPEIQRVYAPLFQSSLKPYSESNENLKNLFNIHSGGGDRVLDFQMQTFKALCDNASFDDVLVGVSGAAGMSQTMPSSAGGALTAAGADININLHIHLPENKTRRDYEIMIEDIGRYIFGRNNGGHRE